MNMYKGELTLSKELAIMAGIEIMNIYNSKFDFELKEDLSPITIADKKSNQIIVDGLMKHFPDYSVLSEEQKDDRIRLKNDFCFIVDPLDGTKEFINRNGEFTVNIALSIKNEVVIGVVYIPFINELYYASKGDGAFFAKINNGKIIREERVFVSDRLKDLIVATSKSHSTEMEKNLFNIHKDKIKTIISAGSSIKGCLVASGNADCYYRFGKTFEWDTAAMQCIVEEAGGIFRQMDGSEMTYNRENSLNEKGFYVVNRMDNIWE
jgi:3'(2'), 5'-bisphosphate nucleotidase